MEECWEASPGAYREQEAPPAGRTLPQEGPSLAYRNQSSWHVAVEALVVEQQIRHNIFDNNSENFRDASNLPVSISVTNSG